MKTYKIGNDRYLMTDGHNVFEVNESVALSEQQKEQPKKLKRFILIADKYYKSVKALSSNGIKTDYADPANIEYIIENDTIKVNDGEYKFEVSKSDVSNTVVFIKSGYSKPELSFLYKELHNLGILVINDPNAVSNTSNKWITYQLLNKDNIKQPKSTLVTSADISKKDHTAFEKKLKSIYRNPQDNDKYVCKILNGHGGHGVFICRNKNILSIIQCIFAINKDEHVLIQEFINIKEGDIRANVLTVNNKQKLINAVKRTKGKKHDFRTNLSLGGHAEEIELSTEQKKLAFTAARTSGLTWAGVDIIEDTDDNNYIVEINGAPGTPFDVEDQEELLQKNTEFYNKVVNMIDEML